MSKNKSVFIQLDFLLFVSFSVKNPIAQKCLITWLSQFFGCSKDSSTNTEIHLK
jgi:hypothetical protein